MTTQHQLPHNLHPQSLGNCALRGAGIAFVLAAIFMLVFFRGAHLAFGLWTVLPLLTVPVGGAFGGMFHFLMDYLRYQGGWKKVVAAVFSLLVYSAGLWLSLIAAFAATGLWD